MVRKTVTGLFVLAGTFIVLNVGGLAHGSSHREAPAISTDPNADNIDLYAFVSPDRPSTVTIISNFIPFEDPAGGPNFHRFGDDVRYVVYIDNDGDAVEDIPTGSSSKRKSPTPTRSSTMSAPLNQSPTPTSTFVRLTPSPESTRRVR